LSITHSTLRDLIKKALGQSCRAESSDYGDDGEAHIGKLLLLESDCELELRTTMEICFRLLTQDGISEGKPGFERYLRACRSTLKKA
jgi:hypothetical protein